MLVGKPPFETSCLKDTYARIKKNEYHVPSTRVSQPARNIIHRLLRADPTTRPNMDQILEDEFFTAGEMIPSASGSKRSVPKISNCKHFGVQIFKGTTLYSDFSHKHT